MSRVIFIVAAMAGLVAAPSQAQFAQARQIDYPMDGVQLGNGWSSLAASKTPGGCVEFKQEGGQSEARRLELKRVVDKEQLNRELNVSAEFQAKAMSGLNGSAKANYTKSVELKSESLNIAVIASVRRDALFTAPAAGAGSLRLTDSARAKAEQDLSAFVRECGDSFVAAIYGGGELNAVLSFDTKSSDEREMLSASVSASNMGFGGSASLEQTLKRYAESQRLNISLYSDGGSGVALPVDEKSLMDAVRNLPAAAAAAPKPYQISTARYDALPNWPAASLPATRFAALEPLVAQYQRFSSLYFDASGIIQRPENYVFRKSLTLASVQDLQDELRTVILPSLQQAIAACIAGGDCAQPSVAAPLDYGWRARMPVARYSFSEDSQIAALSSRRDSAQTHYQATPRNIVIPGLNVQIPNPAKFAAKQALDDGERALASARDNYPAAVATAMFKQWIEMPSFYRCRVSVVDDYCLSQAALNDWKARIRQLVE